MASPVDVSSSRHTIALVRKTWKVKSRKPVQLACDYIFPLVLASLLALYANLSPAAHVKYLPESAGPLSIPRFPITLSAQSMLSMALQTQQSRGSYLSNFTFIISPDVLSPEQLVEVRKDVTAINSSSSFQDLLSIVKGVNATRTITAAQYEAAKNDLTMIVNSSAFDDLSSILQTVPPKLQKKLILVGETPSTLRFAEELKAAMFSRVCNKTCLVDVDGLCHELAQSQRPFPPMIPGERLCHAACEIPVICPEVAVEPNQTKMIEEFREGDDKFWAAVVVTDVARQTDTTPEAVDITVRMVEAYIDHNYRP